VTEAALPPRSRVAAIAGAPSGVLAGAANGVGAASGSPPTTGGIHWALDANSCYGLWPACLGQGASDDD
jgi:hypothetical protein